MCEQPVEEGPCEGNFERWYFDKEQDTCRPFRYGGCKGNKNNFPTEHACKYQCRRPGVRKGISYANISLIPIAITDSFLLVFSLDRNNSLYISS